MADESYNAIVPQVMQYTYTGVHPNEAAAQTAASASGGYVGPFASIRNAITNLINGVATAINTTNNTQSQVTPTATSVPSNALTQIAAVVLIVAASVYVYKEFK